jgi:hypothetical protein
MPRWWRPTCPPTPRWRRPGGAINARFHGCCCPLPNLRRRPARVGVPGRLHGAADGRRGGRDPGRDSVLAHGGGGAAGSPAPRHVRPGGAAGHPPRDRRDRPDGRLAAVQRPQVDPVPAPDGVEPVLDAVPPPGRPRGPVLHRAARRPEAAHRVHRDRLLVHGAGRRVRLLRPVPVRVLPRGRPGPAGGPPEGGRPPRRDPRRARGRHPRRRPGGDRAGGQARAGPQVRAAGPRRACRPRRRRAPPRRPDPGAAAPDHAAPGRPAPRRAHAARPARGAQEPGGVRRCSARAPLLEPVPPTPRVRDVRDRGGPHPQRPVVRAGAAGVLFGGLFG